MVRWLKRLALVVLVGTAIRWALGRRARTIATQSTAPPTIGGDTWPPVPVKPVDGR